MSILDHTPTFSIEDATQLMQKLYNLHGIAKALPSERDQNFLLQTEDGERYVLKIANATEERALLEAQNQVLAHLAKSISFCPRVVPTGSGDEIAMVRASSGAQHFVRLVTYLDGVPLGDVKHHSDGLLYDLGYKIGKLTKALTGFDHPALHRDFHWDLAKGPGTVRKNGKRIRDAALRDAVLRLASAFDELTALFGLASMRLCMSVCIAIDQQASQPDNDYLGISH